MLFGGITKSFLGALPDISVGALLNISVGVLLVIFVRHYQIFLWALPDIFFVLAISNIVADCSQGICR